MAILHTVGSANTGAVMQICKIAHCAGMATLLMACNTTSPQWDADFGSATRSVFAQQIIDPGASRNADPVSGMDGRAAHSAYQRMNGVQAASGASGGDSGGSSGSSSGSKGRGGNAADVNFGVNAQTGLPPGVSPSYFGTSGQFYQGVAGGVVNTSNGAFSQDVGAGFVNSQTGAFTVKP